MPPDEMDNASKETQEISAAPSGPAGAAVEPGPDTILGKSLNRRSFLAAAALGAAAAGFLNKTGDGLRGLAFGPLSGFAHPLDDFNCQSDDVRVLSPFTIINEPCNCPTGSTFAASAVAVMYNNASSERYCVTVHLPTKTLSSGQTFGGDFLAATSLVGKTTQTVTTVISNFPCGAGDVTFGGNLPADYVKGPCPETSKPCAGISWQVPGDFAGSCPPTGVSPNSPSKCRIQQIRIIGRAADLTCVSNCTPTCGGVSTLVASASGGSPPYIFRLGGQTVTNASAASFTVTTTAPTTYTATVDMRDGCTLTRTLALNAAPLSTFSPSVTGPGCDGLTTICASLAGATRYSFSDEGGAFATVTSTASACATRTYTPTTATQTHVLSVVASNSEGCASTGTAAVTVNPALTVSLAAAAAGGCTSLSGSDVTFTATPTGGSGGYVFTWTRDGATLAGVTGSTFTYTASPDAATHTVAVSVRDSSTCVATTTPKTVSQCVSTTVN